MTVRSGYCEKEMLKCVVGMGMLLKTPEVIVPLCMSLGTPFKWELK